jgi:holo-[acyl-carrier protein] synthase
MDIVGVGTEIVECLRVARMVERHGELFLTRVYTEAEIRFCNARRRTTEHFAAHWAAKEAVFKALGAGWRRGMSWTDVEIHADAAGGPGVLLQGAARELAAGRVGHVLLTLAHCRAYATATALAVRGK